MLISGIRDKNILEKYHIKMFFLPDFILVSKFELEFELSTPLLGSNLSHTDFHHH